VRLQHVSISVGAGGAERAREFYGGVLGLEERDVPPTLDPAQFVWFRVGGDLELHCMLRDEEPPRSAHFCLAVDGSLDELRARLERAGTATSDAEEIVGRPRFFCSDPFGNRVELTRFEQ
jgi:catechol 2,3-dioxygenase-like lactoylglutathione lyase family enzyme